MDNMSDIERAAIREFTSTLVPGDRTLLVGMIFQAGGCATQPLLEENPDYIFPSEKVKDNLDHLCKEWGL